MQTDTNSPASKLGFRVERCGASDFDGIFLLLQQLWPDKSLNRETLRALFREVVRSGSRTLLKAVIDSRIVGFGSMTLKPHFWHAGLIAWVDELVVDKDHRGLGIGRALLARLAEIARENGCRAMELDSAFHREEAHSFYENLGFEKRACLFSRKLDKPGL